MKKNLLFSVLIFFYCSLSFAQVISIQPNSAFRGSNLTTTITLASGAMTTASPPLNTTDVYIQQGATIVYSTTFSIYQQFPNFSDSLEA